MIQHIVKKQNLKHCHNYYEVYLILSEEIMKLVGPISFMTKMK